MIMSGRFLFFCLVLVLCTDTVPVSGIFIRFTELGYQDGFYNDVDSFKGDCADVESVFSAGWGSIETDTCLMVYSDNGCAGYSAKVLPGTTKINYELYSLPDRKNWKPIRSYRPCTLTEGGPQLNVDLFVPNRPKYEFKNLCGCRNLPEITDTNAVVSADNHGTPFKVYTESDCPSEGSSRVIPAGKSPWSEDLANIRVEKATPVRIPIRSIGPYIQSDSFKNNCVKLTSTVFKFDFTSDSDDTGAKQEFVEMATKTVFRNDGPATLTQEYKVSKTITETKDLTVASALSNMHKGTLETKVTIEGKAAVPFVAKGDFKDELRTAYDYTNTATYSNTTKNVTTTSQDFTLRQQITVDPCIEKTVRSFVTTINDKPFPYYVHSKITGELDGQRITAQQIKKYVSGSLDIVDVLDEYTVVVVAKAVMKASFGVESEFVSKGDPIPGCVP